jgi:hypothetical protein
MAEQQGHAGPCQPRQLHCAGDGEGGVAAQHRRQRTDLAQAGPRRPFDHGHQGNASRQQFTGQLQIERAIAGDDHSGESSTVVHASDVALMDALKDCAAEGGDPGQAATLEAYARARADDHARTAGFSDSLARGFALDWPLVSMARSGALLAFNAVPPLRHALRRRLMGATARMPEWLRSGSTHA